MTKPTYKFEKKKLVEGYQFIVGCDEVGRGCLAGPVVAAAIVLPAWEVLRKQSWHKDIRDSKLVSPEKRFMLEKKLRETSLGFGIGVVSEQIIDKINIHHASLLAMQKAVEHLLDGFSHGTSGTGRDETLAKGFMFVDGRFPVPGLAIGQESIIDGDAKVISISAASIIAKTYRDRLMVRWHKKMPDYRFDQHKGYATKLHRQLLVKHGISVLHRRSFLHQAYTV